MESRNFGFITALVFFYLILVLLTKIYLRKNGHDISLLRTRIRDLNLLFEVSKKYKNGIVRKLHFLIYLFIIIFPLIVIGLFISSQPSSNYMRCMIVERFKEQNYSGVIVDKYIDEENHSNETLIVQNRDKKSTIIDFIYLPREDFNIIQIGDSIFKESGDEFILMKRDSIHHKFYLEVDCDYQKYQEENEKFK